MAFETTTNKIRAVNRAGNILGLLRTVYGQMEELIAAAALYQSGSDPAFNAAFNALFTAVERAAIADIIRQIATFKTDWDETHPEIPVS